MTNIFIVTDAWSPQINGVVTSIVLTIRELEALGHKVEVIDPSQYRSFPVPSYPTVPLVYGVRDIASRLKPPCAIHIATEGGLGLSYRNYCHKNKIPFTTVYHTNYPEYNYYCLPEGLTWTYLRWFHNAGKGVMVSTNSLAKKLKHHRFNSLRLWSRGVDIELFKPVPHPKKNRLLYVGRIAQEKNLRAFLDLKGDYEKIVVGDGPLLDGFKKNYPHITFTGALLSQKLADQYALADCFVFPSKTDTFGLVL